VTPSKTLVQFLASDELMDTFENAKAPLLHSYPDASFAEVLGVLLSCSAYCSSM